MESLRCVRTFRCWLHAALGIILVAAPGGAALAQAMPDEYEVRAAIILNLTKFVLWPPAKSANAHAPFVIGLLGYDQQGAVLEKLLAARAVEGRPVMVRRLARTDRTDDCSLVYVASSEQKHYEELRAQLTKDSVLTVSDDVRFASGGGVVGLPVAGDRIEIQINLAQAQRSGLTISSRLLHLATVVGQ